jgi:hypothetical protein
MIINNWLPRDKKAAVCFTIDDLHPARLQQHGYDAGGDLDKGVFKHVDWLLNRHPQLLVTFFTTADWREKTPLPTRKTLAKIPYLRDYFYLADLFPKGTFSLDKHPEFVTFYNEHPQVEIGLHGLYHCHKGLKIPVEFQNESFRKCNAAIEKMIAIFEQSGIQYIKGFTPPAWNASANLMQALFANGVETLCSARDIKTPVTADAINKMSGLPDVSILYPEWIFDNKLIHIATNFQVTSDFERAAAIIEHQGILSIKAHMIKELNGFVSIDGVDSAYMQYLDTVLSKVEDKYGDDIWWTSISQLTQKIKKDYNGLHP